MNAWVDILFSAMARQEGEFAGKPDTPVLRNNPLDLRYAGQFAAYCPRCGAKGGFAGLMGECRVDGFHDIAQFATLPHGIASGYRQIWVWIDNGLSLRSLITTEAPATENRTDIYLANVKAWTGIQDENVPLLYMLKVEPPPGVSA